MEVLKFNIFNAIVKKYLLTYKMKDISNLLENKTSLADLKTAKVKEFKTIKDKDGNNTNLTFYKLKHIYKRNENQKQTFYIYIMELTTYEKDFYKLLKITTKLKSKNLER